MVKKLSLTNFRRFENLNLDFDNHLTIFTGGNALGKTSVLEAIYLVSSLKSERCNKLEYLIKFEAPYAKVRLLSEDLNYEVVLSNKSKKYFINNKEIVKASDFVGKLNCIYFSPNDLKLVTGSPEGRRRFLNLEISLLNKKYLDSLNKAKYFLKQRNEALKSEAKDSILNLLTDSFVSSSSVISKSRIKFIELLNSKLETIHSQIASNEKIKLKYIPSYDINNPLDDLNNLNKDKLYKTTTKGYHRDDFKIYLNSMEAINFASEGQIRNIALSIKLALVEVYKDYLGKSPLLLLDDVFSELDKTRQANIIDFVLKSDQTLITTNSLDSIPKELLKNANVIEFKE